MAGRQGHPRERSRCLPGISADELVYGKRRTRLKSLELWRLGPMARVVKVSPGNESGFWTDLPAIVQVFFARGGRQFEILAPGNQPCMLELPPVAKTNVVTPRRRWRSETGTPVGGTAQEGAVPPTKIAS
ncbi:hypothetical protein [Amycolatopsis sp. H20-H5]|uniref:hypothetical protein n=1 Tax=Amycolatopsis sp. H20-H5 TaxID=3046309 RepID=UPI002DBF88A9|nr:hypothetical protein [Amycolatopsis sp. H20-H5]MEC3977028.1 hypothetical protein [Amycolatopsis sp. H20-H5]